MKILVLNTGSGTVTATTYARDRPDDPLLAGRRVTLVHHSDPATIAVDGAEARDIDERPFPDQCRRLLDTADLTEIDAVGHRVVHGGFLATHAVIDDSVRAALDEASDWAPIHNPPALAIVDLVSERLPGVPAVACLDTAFHGTIPREAAVYGGPKRWWEKGLRRYGFHGISHEAASRHAAIALGRRVEDVDLITVHGGGGASATAVAGGRSVDTTMGLTPAEGPMMAARSGSVDPGLILHLLRDKDLDVNELEALLMQRAGLLGLSGISGDEVRLREMRAVDDDADLAVRAYVHQLSAAIASMLPALRDRPHALVFTGSVLESDAELRADLCDALRFLGVRIDADANRAWRRADSVTTVSGHRSEVEVVVVQADEESSIAGITDALVGGR